MRKLPPRTRDALLRVSALRQPTRSALDAAALEPAVAAGIVRVAAEGDRVEFEHPLFAAGVYAEASRARRRRLHAELAESAADVEERARHLLLARPAEVEDEPLAATLFEAAEYAVRRGAVESAAELAERSAQLTPARLADARRQRSLRAARHHLKAGDPAHANRLCTMALDASPPDSARAEALLLMAEAAMNERSTDASRLLEQALACVGDDLARAAQIEGALGLVRFAQLDYAGASQHTARAVALAERAGDASSIAEAIANNAIADLVLGKGIDERVLERALALEDPDREVPFQMPATMNVASAYQYMGRIEVSRPLFVKLRDRLVARGDEADLPWVMCLVAAASWLGGELEGAEREANEAERAATLIGSALFRAFALQVRAATRAQRGDAVGARADAAEGLTLSERIGWGAGVVDARWALATLALAEGAPAAAAAWLTPVIAEIEKAGVYE